MILSERHIIKHNHKYFKEIDEICFNSKNLYNTGLYRVRQHFFENKKYLNNFELINTLTKEKQDDYIKLPAQASQQTLRMVDKNFKSFFGSLKVKKNGTYKKSINIPKYLKKNGRYITVYTKQTVSRKTLEDKGLLKPLKSNIFIKTNVLFKDLKQVRFVPKNGYYVVEILYEVKTKSKLKDNKKYLSIDLGLNNLATCSSNVKNKKNFIVNGKPLKSINQFYNKTKAKYNSKYEKNKQSKNSNRLKSLSLKRTNKINDYFHKSSRYIINHLVFNNINTIIIGYNKGWKQEINIGKKNNQKFVDIPFYNFIKMIEYKAELEGINVIVHEESYTSKCSFLDEEYIKKHETYKGKRIKRGLFKSSEGLICNADINGSYNIMKKVVGKTIHRTVNSIAVCSAPVIKTF